jgi:glycosyltransferase involved in cell wall biosynthesis
MKILFEHKNPLPVKEYGGTERIIFWLMKELDRRGHHVLLIGHPDSILKGTNITLIPHKSEETQNDFRSLIPADVDITHLFYNPHFPLPTPHLITIEGNGRANEYFSPNTVFVSEKHARNHGSQHYVYNGLDFNEYPHPLKKLPLKNDWNQFLFLAKAKWKVKNLKGCVQAAKKAKVHLHVAGGKAWSFSPYIHSYGMVGQEKKLELLRRTHGLLFPVRWHEPFGIAIIEAFSQGLPVIGTPYGSLPELIPPEMGFIVNNAQELYQALQDPPRSFDGEQIRHLCEQRFSVQLMADRYEDLYQTICAGRTLQQDRPTLQDTSRLPEDLLPF